MKIYFKTSALVIFSFLFIFSNPSFAQEAQTPEALVSLAQSYEKVKSYKLAAENYMLAGKAFEAKAKEYTSDALINKNLQAGVDSYLKARDMYNLANNSDMENEARREAIRTSMPLTEKKMKAYEDSIKKNPPPDLKAAIKQKPWKPGKEVFLKARKATFAIILPDVLKYNPLIVRSKATMPMLRENETTVELIENLNTTPRFGFYLKEHISGAGSETIQDYCDREKEQFNEKTNPFLGQMEVKLVNIGAETKACLSTNESRQIDTKRFMFGFTMIFQYKNNSYLFVGSAPYEWKTCVLEMLKTFRIVDEQTPSDDLSCSGNSFREVPGLAFDDTWMLPDPKGSLIIKLSPNLPRNSVPHAWHDVINATRKLVGQIQELSAKFETKEEQGVEMNVLEFVVDYLNVPQITPGALADAYLNVLDKVITGISSLEGKISGLTVDLSYELPFSEIKTKCIPRFKCVNGKWQPDYSNMTFEKVSEARRVDKKEYLNLSPGVLKQTAAKINELPNLLKANAKKVDEKECGQHRYKLHEIKWPPDPRECDQIERKVSVFEDQLKMYSGEKTELKKELTEYSNSKSRKIEGIKKFIAQINEELKIKEKDLIIAKTEKKTYELNKESMDKTQFDLQIQKVNDKIKKLELETEALNLEKADWNEKLAMLQSDQFEKINYDRTQFVDAEIARLNNEIKVLDSQLKSCRDKEKLFNKN